MTRANKKQILAEMWTTASPQPAQRQRSESKAPVLLLKPPFFSPWTPPLGIAILKRYLAAHGHQATCFDYNTDSELWGLHHSYFGLLRQIGEQNAAEGYSKLWFILNAHLLAYVNGADQSVCGEVLQDVMPFYGFPGPGPALPMLHRSVERFFARLSQVTSELDLGSFTMVGTSSYTTSLAPSLHILRFIKQRYPHIRTVMGGGIFADDLAHGSENLDTLLKYYSFVDHVVLGEGEELLLQLAEGTLVDQRVLTISSIGGQTLDIADSPVPDFSDFHLERYHHLSIEGGRSCPFQCNFCSETLQWGTYRRKSSELLAAQMVRLANDFDNHQFFMGDSLMNPYLSGLATSLLQNGSSVLYDGYLRADRPVQKRENALLWSASGLYRARIGLESASPRLLKAMSKETTPEGIEAALKSLSSAAIRPTTYWIVGFPGETEEDHQSNLVFIANHHRNIYELESHPYYYYPYGQIHSRLFSSHSLYPDKVTDVIRFKEWEIDDIVPKREERYRRLAELAELANELGIPNIYSIRDRHAAEERWHRLHPTAREVYPGTRRCRPIASTAGGKITAPAEALYWQTTPAGSSTLGFHVRLARDLQPELVAAAASEVVRHNEILRATLKDDIYEIAAADRELSDELTSWHQSLPDGTPGASTPEAVIAFRSLNLEPVAGRSFHIAVVRHSDAHTDLLILAHRAVADARSVVLMVEDFFRLYRQLETKQPFALEPAVVPLSDDVVRRAAVAGNTAPRTAGSPMKTLTLPLAAECAGKLSSWRPWHQVFPAHTLISIAALRAMTTCAVSVSMRFDARMLWPELERTRGPIIVTRPLTADLFNDDEVLAYPALLRSALARESGSADADTRPSNDALLNVELTATHPWLGGDDWVPYGFIPPESHSSIPSLEVVPLRRGNSFDVLVHYARTRADWVSAFAESFRIELADLIARCEEQAARTTRQRQELGNAVFRF